MRYGLFSTCSAALLGAFVSAGPASAQGRPTWVDPPAKADPSPKVDPSLKADPASKPASPVGAPAVATESGPQGSASPSVQPDAATAEAQAPSAGERTAEAAPRVRGRTRQAGSAGRRPYRRLSQVPPAPLAITVAPGMAAASADRFPEWAAKAQGLNEDYLDAVSAPGDGMVAAAPRFYGERVRFHGRTMSLAALMAEKRRFVRRWPERRYVVQDGSPRTACSAATASCIVRSTFDFRADNPRAGARSQGVAELVLDISFAGPRPVIVAESSRVLRRYAPGAVSAAPASQRGA